MEIFNILKKQSGKTTVIKKYQKVKVWYTIPLLHVVTSDLTRKAITITKGVNYVKRSLLYKGHP